MRARMRAALTAVAVAFVALTSLAAPGAAGAAAGGQVPFKGTLAGVETTTSIDPGFPPVAHILGEWTGNANHLGRYTLENLHTVNCYVSVESPSRIIAQTWGPPSGMSVSLIVTNPSPA